MEPHRGNADAGFWHFAECRRLTALLVPVLVGATLPFWLRPPRFSFKWLAGAEFLIATVLVYAGFALLHARFQGRSVGRLSTSRLLVGSIVCLVAGCTLGMHLNSGLTLHPGVPSGIFLVYGLGALFVGVLYVVPPLSYSRRAGGEIVLAIDLGLMPVLGAYLVQVGDLTRTVYHAALPLVIGIGLWVWLGRLARQADDERAGRESIVMLFRPRVSGRFVVLALVGLLYATLGGAVITRSIHPISLIALLSLWFGMKAVRISWDDGGDKNRMLEAHRHAFLAFMITGIIIVASNLASLLR